MNNPPPVVRSLSILAIFVVLTGLAQRVISSDQPDLIIKPFLLSAARVPVTADSQVLIYNPADRGQQVELLGLELFADGVLIHSQELNTRLPGDPQYGRVGALVERLPHELAHRRDHLRYFADPEATTFEGPLALQVMRDIKGQVSAMNERYRSPQERPFENVSFPLHIDQVFHGAEPPGTTAKLLLSIRWRGDDGRVRNSSLVRRLEWLGAWPALPSSFQAGHGTASVHSGDLHVHTCHGESLGACSPSENCTAETLQVSGSFSLAQLRSQYQALGLDWYTASDHSYCINSDGEYAAIASEAAAITDASFLCIPDTELSSDEQGPQEGSDLGDVLCLGTTSANHMGAHGIGSRIYGGDDGLLGFCDGLFGDALNGFKQNVATIRDRGGYPIIHHPDGSSFGWNSRADTVGMEAGGLHGVEIWNGGSQLGQGGHVQDWVEWLLAGRLLYAYSGSDTHDEAFDFGANRVILEGDFNITNLEAALEAGSLYVSNGPALIIEADLGAFTLPMGALHTLPTPIPVASTTVRVYYDFGADTGSIHVFRGRAGDSAEQAIGSSGSLTGSGFIEVVDTLQDAETSWYRAYAQNSSASRAAYTNPIFFQRGESGIFAYCAPKVTSGGCVPVIGWHGVPSFGSGVGFLITAEQVVNKQFGILVYAHEPSFVPFFGGTLCLGAGLRRLSALPTNGNSGPKDCSGTMSYDFNTWIAFGNDSSLVPGATAYAQWWFREPGDTQGVGLTDAVQFTILP